MTEKILDLKDIFLLTFFSNFGIRWLAVAAGLGPSAISYWIIGAIMLALPLAIMCAQLSRLYPEAGGLYAWTRHTLGEKKGFIVAWLYFINNLFYYPAILIFLATNFAYVLGAPALAKSTAFIATCVLISFWLVILISVFGLKLNRFATEFGGLFGSLIPTLLIILLAILYYRSTHLSATHFSTRQLFSFGSVNTGLSNLTMLMFAMTGVEIIPTFANSVKNAKRNLYLGLILGAIALVIFYIIGTIAINTILPPDEIHKTSGLMDAFQLVLIKLHLQSFTPFIAMMLVFSELGIVSMWLIAPVTMLFKCSPKGALPTWFQKIDKNGTPVNALLLIGCIVSLILLSTTCLPAVNNMYQVLVLMSVLLTFIPYLFIVRVYILNIKKIPGNAFWKKLFSMTVFISLLLGILFSFSIPNSLTTLKSKLIYESELLLGPLLFILVGYYIFKRYEKGQKNEGIC